MALLHQIKTIRALDILPLDKVMLWSAFTLACYGFLHSSEVNSSFTTHLNPLLHLSQSDVSFLLDGWLSLQLKASKTDQYHQGCSLLLVPSDCFFCAVWVIHKYLALHSSSKEALLYIVHSGLYLTRVKVTSVPCLILQHMSVPTEQDFSQVYLFGLFRHLNSGPATALHSTSETHLAFFREYPVY